MKFKEKIGRILWVLCLCSVLLICGFLIIMRVPAQIIATDEETLRLRKCLEPSKFPYGRPEHPPELTSSRELIMGQNKLADSLSMPLINNKDFNQLKKNGYLVPFEGRSYMVVTVKNKLRFSTKSLGNYLNKLGEDFYTQFGYKLKITQLSRTPQEQARIANGKRVIKTKRKGKWRSRVINVQTNAIPITCCCPELRSLHERGNTGDISRRVIDRRGRQYAMTSEQLEWMRLRLIKDKTENNDRVQPSEEGTCFHIVIFDGTFLAPKLNK